MKPNTSGNAKRSGQKGQAKPVDPEKVFFLAEAFSEASAGIERRWRGEATLHTLPVVVNAAFALELYLKCFLAIETGTAPEGHDLKELWRNLNRQTKAILKKRHAALTRKDKGIATLRRALRVKTDLDSLLEQGKDVFSILRYAYEDNLPNVVWALGPLMSCVRARILELRPEWKDRQLPRYQSTRPAR